jgi:hypothetical protein
MTAVVTPDGGIAVRTYRGLSLATLTPNSQYGIAVVSKAYKKHKQQGFVSRDKGKATNLWVFGIELARLYSNFNYELV